MNKLSLLLLLMVAHQAIYGQNSRPEIPRILISTDIGGTDPDDNQSMIHLLMYNDLFQIEGLVSSPSFGKGSKQEILRMIDIYEKDYPKLKKNIPMYLSPAELRKLCKQGRSGTAPFAGYSTATEGSEWIVKCAREKSEQPLWVLVWGGLEDLAQALHDAPDIQNRIKVYWIGGPNKKWSVNSYAYIAENYPNLWMIEANASYRGFIADDKKNDKFNKLYYDNCIKGAGHLGEDFINYYGGNVKMGDTPSLLYMMDGDPNDPLKESWGGSFERLTYTPRTIFTRNTTMQDTVPVYSIVEFQFSGPRIEKPIGTPCFVMTIDRQNWDGYYLGEGRYGIRYSPKAPATLEYTITSDIPVLNGQKGVFVIDKLWPGTCTEVSYKLGDNWFTDKIDLNLFEGKWQGFKTVSKWRNAVLSDWEKRLNWLK